jgi:hypothetical protein
VEKPLPFPQNPKILMGGINVNKASPAIFIGLWHWVTNKGEEFSSEAGRCRRSGSVTSQLKAFYRKVECSWPKPFKINEK